MKLIVLAFALASSVVGHSQMSSVQKNEPSITVGKVAPVGSFIAELSYRVIESDTMYTFRFRDAKYDKITSIKSVSFANIENTVGSLYEALKSVFNEENRKNKDYSISFKLGENEVLVRQFKMMGSLMTTFFTEGSWVYLSEKQLDKVFGR